MTLLTIPPLRRLRRLLLRLRQRLLLRRLLLRLRQRLLLRRLLRRLRRLLRRLRRLLRLRRRLPRRPTTWATVRSAYVARGSSGEDIQIRSLNAISWRRGLPGHPEPASRWVCHRPLGGRQYKRGALRQDQGLDDLYRVRASTILCSADGGAGCRPDDRGRRVRWSA